MTIHETTQLSVLDTLNQRVSIRRYTDQAIDDGLLHQLLEAARRSPTSSNTQTYSIIVVKDPDTKRQLAVLAGNQKQIETAPVFIALTADIHRMSLAADLHGQTIARNLENTMVSVVDASLVGMSLSLAAESVGLGTVMIGAMRNHPQEVADLLGLPDGVFVVYGLCLGYPEVARIPAQKPRLPYDLVVHAERYADSHAEPLFRQHDAELAAHYRGEGRDTQDAAWTGFIAERFNAPHRPHLRTILEGRGFRFE